MQSTLERLQRRRGELQEREGGFTLIELLIVIVILGILAAIVVFAVQNLGTSSYQATCQSDYKTVETAVEAYKAQMGDYPSGSATAAGATGTGSSGATPTTDSDIGTVVTYAASSAPAYGASATAGQKVVNAAASGKELLTGSAATSGGTTDANGATTANNYVSSGNVGPWLKDVPANTGHFTIFAANDGSGTVAVLDGTGNWLASSATGCSSVK